MVTTPNTDALRVCEQRLALGEGGVSGKSDPALGYERVWTETATREGAPMVTVHRASTGADWREATALLHDYVEWVRGWTDIDPVAEQPQLHTELACLADHYATDDAALYLATWHAIAVGAVAIRIQPDGSAELKRMYVRPIARGRGIADRLIDAAVTDATERQCHTAWLETVRGAMDPAIAVYRRNGFVESSTRPPTLSMDGVIVMERILSVASRCA